MSSPELDLDAKRDLDMGRADHEVGLEELERESIVLQAALVAALGEMPDIPKARTANAGAYGYSFADLGDTMRLVRPVLAKHFLAIVQPLSCDASTITIKTRILHVAGGRYDGGDFTVPLDRNMQATGSAISYGRRYAALAALGIAAYDDDAQTAVAEQPAPKSKVDDVAGALMRRMGALMDDAGVPKDRPTRRAIVASIIGRKIKSAAETTVPERERVCDQFQAIMDGRAELELVDDDTWLIHAIDPEEAT